MKMITGQRMRSLLVHLNDRYFIYPPRNVGRKTAVIARQQGFIEIEGDLGNAFKCRLTPTGVKARAELNRQLKS